MFFFYFLLIGGRADIFDKLCYCQSDKEPHFKEKKDKTNPCNAIELHINGTWIKDFNPKISEQWLQTTPIVKFPGKKLVKHDFMTLVLFKPVSIHTLKQESQRNVYVHWLISQIPSATSRFGHQTTEYAFNLSPGYQYIEYLQPTHNQQDNKYILAFYHQHETKDYFAAHRYRKFDDFFQSLGKMVVCNVIEIIQ